LCGASTIGQNGDFTASPSRSPTPNLFPAARRDATVRFVVDGRRALEMPANDVSLHRSFDLTSSEFGKRV
jgi:hypothetical protein